VKKESLLGMQMFCVGNKAEQICRLFL